jgi:hypothetical protein
MEARPGQSKAFRFRDPRKANIHDRLRRLVGPGAADFWKDACVMLDPETPVKLESTTHLAAHLLREIESSVRRVLQLVPPGKAVDNVAESGKGHRADILAIVGALGVSVEEPWARAWLGLSDDQSSITLPKLAHRAALGPPRPVDAQFKAFWDDMEIILDIVLQKFEAQYLTVFAKLDELLEDGRPTPKALDTLRQSVPHNYATREYFFDKLNEASWLVPLAENGFFGVPPSPEWDSEGGTAAFPRWPESRYLVRMAEREPEIVRKIALEIADTENVRVHEDLADVALELPPHLAVEFVPKSKKWLESRYQFLLPEKLARLVRHLADGRQVDASLELAGCLFAVLPDRASSEQVNG